MNFKSFFGPDSKNLTLFYIVQGMVLFALILALFPVSEIKFSTDSMSYISKGSWIAESLKYADFTRGPMFPVLTALAITIFGHTAFVLMIMVRVAYVACVLAFGLFAWRLYGLVGAWTSGLYFAVAPLVQWPATKFHVDIFLLMFVLLALVTLYEAHRSENRSMGLVAGVCLGCAFLTKETALLLFPLLAVSWVFFSRNRQKALRISGAAVAGLVGVLLPWALLVFYFTGEFAIILGENINKSGTFQTFTGVFFGTPVEMINFSYEKLINFVRVYFLNHGSFVAAMGSYGWILLAGTAHLVARAVVLRRSGDLLVVAALVLHTPFMVYLGWNTYDHRQALIIFALAAFGVGALFGDLQRGLRKLAPFSPDVSGGAVFAVFVVAWVGTMAYTPSFKERFGGHFHSFTFFAAAEGSFNTSGALGPSLVEASAWLAEILTAEEAVMAAHPRPTRYMEFALDNRVVAAPIAKYNLRERQTRNLEGVDTELTAQDDLIYVNVNRSPNGPLKCVDDDRKVRGVRFCKLYYLKESALLEKIRKTEVRYLLVNPRHSFLEKYLEQNTGMRKVETFGDRTKQPSAKNLRDAVTIYRIDDSKPVDGYLRPAVTDSFPRFLNFYREIKSEEYAVWRSEVLSERFGASRRQIESIEAGDVGCFTFDLKRPQMVECMEMKKK